MASICHLERTLWPQQPRAGRRVGVPNGSRPATCSVRAYRARIEAAELSEGAVFRPIDRHGNIGDARITDRGVALVVKRRAEMADIDPSEVSWNPFRAGLATLAAAARVQERVIAQTTGHKSMTVLRRCIREGDLFRENAAAAVGL
jgi:hypothetical protein